MLGYLQVPTEAHQFDLTGWLMRLKDTSVLLSPISHFAYISPQPIPAVGLYMCTDTPSCLSGWWGSKPRSSGFCGRHITNRTISSAYTLIVL